jgi:protein SDA1
MPIRVRIPSTDGIMETARLRTTNPELLHKKDRGRPTEAVLTLQRRGYGEQEVLESVPGAEVLRLNEIQEEEDQKKQDEVQ